MWFQLLAPDLLLVTDFRIFFHCLYFFYWMSITRSLNFIKWLINLLPQLIPNWAVLYIFYFFIGNTNILLCLAYGFSWVSKPHQISIPHWPTPHSFFTKISILALLPYSFASFWSFPHFSFSNCIVIYILS